MSIESDFDVGFAARLTADEKQIQQSYRPVIGVHKWFARRPGALLRSLLLAEFAPGREASAEYFRPHHLGGVSVLDPFMGGGTTLFEANRIGCNVIGCDTNPMAYWVVRQELLELDRVSFREAAARVAASVEERVRDLYATECRGCGRTAPVKYFLWVKQQRCRGCGKGLDLFPGYLVATRERHTHFVLHCPGCRELFPLAELPAPGMAECPGCRARFDWAGGSAARGRCECPGCGAQGQYPAQEGPPRHRLFGIEYHCPPCKGEQRGRFFKTATPADERRFERARAMLRRLPLRIPEDEIPPGDETRRLRRWGYTRYREMFSERQLLSLGLLLDAIGQVQEKAIRHALATVLSDSLRYQNMLCRYDTSALKCQDIFSVHGFPVGLIQCEGNVVGIPGVGSGGFRHFVEKYDRAKEYCQRPFETLPGRGSKRTRQVPGEAIRAQLAGDAAELRGERRAWLWCGSLDARRIPRGSVDAVLTDPPYFANVQYAELMDFCFAWLRLLLADDVAEFRRATTRSAEELTGNATSGRDLVHFTEGLSRIFRASSRALRRGGPFVFTYHHNELEAYAPLVVAILDAGLECTAMLPAPAEMTVSLHIHGTASSVMDSVVVCRHRRKAPSLRTRMGPATLRRALGDDRVALARGGVRCSEGDLRCLARGHLLRAAVANLAAEWRSARATRGKIERAAEELRSLWRRSGGEALTKGSENLFPRQQEMCKYRRTGARCRVSSFGGESKP